MTFTAMSLTRRRVLQLIAASGSAAMFGGYAVFAPAAPLAGGYGPDPDLHTGEVPWRKSLTAEQLGVLTILGDLIIPADDRSPKASELDIAGFVNEWVSAPYPEQIRDRKILLLGLAWLDRQARARSGSPFAQSTGAERFELFAELSEAARSEHTDRLPKEFFARIVYLFVGGFYTTAAGMADIGYVGNVPSPSFDGPPPEIRRRLGI